MASQLETDTRRRYERALADARTVALQEYPCKPECLDSLCACDEATRNRRLVPYSQALREALYQALQAHGTTKASLADALQDLAEADAPAV